MEIKLGPLTTVHLWFVTITVGLLTVVHVWAWAQGVVIYSSILVGVDSFANLGLSVVCTHCATFLPRCVAKAALCIGGSSPSCWERPSLLFSKGHNKRPKRPTAGVRFLVMGRGQLAPPYKL